MAKSRLSARPSRAENPANPSSIANSPRRARIDLAPLVHSKAFIVCACSAGGLILISLIVGLLLARPLPEGRDELPALTDLSALEDFKLPDFPERFEKVEFSRDPKAASDPGELASFYYLPEPGAMDEAQKLAREAVEAFYEGIE